MEVCRKLDNIKLENRPYTEVSLNQNPFSGQSDIKFIAISIRKDDIIFSTRYGRIKVDLINGRRNQKSRS